MPETDTSRINPQICTHVIFSFLGITADGSLTYLWRTAAQVTSNFYEILL